LNLIVWCAIFLGFIPAASFAATNAPDTTPPTVSLTAPKNGATVSGTAVWISATASDSKGVASVQFEVDGTNIGAADTRSPYMVIWNSKTVADGVHTIFAVAKDKSGNVASVSISVTVENNAPVISAISAGILTTESATITWTTNQSANSKVTYGKTTRYGSTASNASFVTSHSITLSNLFPSTTYHYEVVSANVVGNTTKSSDQSFTTPSTNTPLPTVTLTASPSAIIAGASATLSWSSTTATSCTASGFSASGTSGSVSVSPSATSNYSITCTGAGGSATASASVTVLVPNNRIYYVSPTGNDTTNTGTSPSSPWETIAKVNAGSYVAGESVLFEGGQNFSGCLNFTYANVLGSPNTPFTVSSYGTGQATITSNCPSPNNSATVTIDGISGFTLNNLILRGSGYTNGTQYIVLLQNNSGQTASNVTVSNNDIGGAYYNVSGSGAGSDDILFLGYSLQGKGCGMNAFNNVSFLNNTIHGLAGVSSQDDNGINSVGCHSNTGPYNLTNVTYQGNTIYNIGAVTNSGTASGQGVGLAVNGVDGALVQDNIIHDIGANSNGCGGAAAFETYDAINVLMQYNEAYNVRPVPGYPGQGCDWDGFDFDISTSNSIMQYNYSHHNAGYGFLNYAPTASGGVPWGQNTVRYNISEDDGWPYFFGGGISTSVVYVYNNVFWGGLNNYEDTTAAFYLLNSPPGQGSIFANNIVATVRANNTGYAELTQFNNINPSGMTFKNNNWFAITGPGRWNQVNGTNCTTLSCWQSLVTGGDTGATTANPMLANPGNGGTCTWTPSSSTGPQPCPTAYELQSGSPLLGTGLDLTQSPYNLNVGTHDYFGNPLGNGVGSGYNIGADGAAR
jgi:Bacterial Ig domain